MSIKIAAAGILATVGFLVNAVPAGAAFSQCNLDHMCMWGNNDFLWLIGERQHGNDVITNLTGERNDEMDSWANRSITLAGCMYQHSNGGGDQQLMAKGSSDSNVAPWNSDEVTSWRTKFGCGGG